MKKKIAYNGCELPPLPYESARNAIMRFAWRNHLRASDLRALLSRHDNYPAKQCHLSLGWIDTELFRDAATWSLPSDEERKFSDAFYSDHHIWIEPRFRYCPICLEYGYHSFLHQFRGIDYCPWHQFPLSTRCHQCDQLTSQYRFAATIFRYPYQCQNGHMISGVELSLRHHLHGREQSSEIERYFSPVYRWVESAKSTRAKFSRLRTAELATSELLSSWSDIPMLIRATCLQLHPIEQLRSASKFTDVEIIEWHIRVHAPDENEDFFGTQRASKERINLPTSVYRCVLRSLYRWILSTDSLTEEEFSNSAHNGGSRIRNHNPRILALLCLRAQLELQAWAIDLFDFENVNLAAMPNVAIPRHSHRTPRLAWRAYFVALFVSWYARILRNSDSTTDTLTFRHNGEGLDVLLSADIANRGQERWWDGLVFFPAISDPLFKKIVLKKRLDSGVLRENFDKKVDAPDLTNDDKFDPFCDLTIDLFLLHLRDRNGRYDDGDESHGERSYRREIDRLAIWAFLCCGKLARELTPNECEQYFDFLMNPQPYEFWSGREGRSRWGDHWHPFRRRLSYASITLSRNIVNSYLNFLSKFGLRTGMPEPNFHLPKFEEPRSIDFVSTAKLISFDDWLKLKEELIRLPADEKNDLARLAAMMLYETGLSLDVLLAVRTSDICQKVCRSSSFFWAIRDSQDRYFGISDETADVILHTLQRRGLNSDDLRSLATSDYYVFEGKAYSGHGRFKASAERTGLPMPHALLDRYVKEVTRKIALTIEPFEPPRAAAFYGLTANRLSRSGLLQRLQEKLTFGEIREATHMTNGERVQSLVKQTVPEAYAIPRSPKI